MADELEELDPDLMFDMPEQQTNGLFGQFADDSLDFRHDALSLSASDLGAGFGNIQTSDLSSMDHPTSSTHHAQFSLADELADAFEDNEHNGTSRLLVELDHDDENQFMTPSSQTSPLRVAKSSRATIASQPQDDVDDKHATNTAFEEEALALHESLRDVKHFQELLEAYNNAPTNRAADVEVRIETLASNLIRKTYEMLKQSEHGIKELEAIHSEIKLAAVWTLPHESAYNKSDDDMLGAGAQELEDRHASKDTSSGETLATAAVHPLESKQDLLQATADFRIITEKVSSSLATILEQIQVDRAAGSDSWRKLRGAETGMGRLKSELESIQVSQERILRWEETFSPKQSAIPGLSSPSPKSMASGSKSDTKTATRSNLGSQARVHLLAAQAMLEDASIRAQKLLTV